MSNPEQPASHSDDIPRAVEYLVQLVLRWILWVLAFGFGVGALVAFIEHWPLYVGIPLAVLCVLTAIGGWAVKSSPGRLVVGRSGRDIGILVPRDRDPKSASPDRT
jgi:hypothetical protein